MLDYQGMVVLVANQIWWTWEVEDTFRKVLEGDKNAMKNYAKQMHRQIGALITQIQETGLTPNNRKKYRVILEL